MSDDSKALPVDAASAARRVQPMASAVEPVEATAAAPSIDPVEALARPAAVLAAIAARFAEGRLDRAAAVRSVVDEVISRALPTVSADARDAVARDVAEVLLTEPSWAIRLDAVLRAPSGGAGGDA